MHSSSGSLVSEQREVEVTFLPFQMKYNAIQERTFYFCFPGSWDERNMSHISRNADTRKCHCSTVSYECRTPKKERYNLQHRKYAGTIPYHFRWAKMLVCQWILPLLFKLLLYCAWTFPTTLITQSWWKKNNACLSSLYLHTDTVKLNQSTQIQP